MIQYCKSAPRDNITQCLENNPSMKTLTINDSNPLFNSDLFSWVKLNWLHFISIIKSKVDLQSSTSTLTGNWKLPIEVAQK